MSSAPAPNLSPTAPAAAAAPPPQPAATSSLNSVDYRRLQDVERLVLECVRIASKVMGELGKITTTDAGLVTRLCSEFVNNIKAAHQLVAEGVERFQGERVYELHAYHALAKAHIFSEKLDVLAMHIEALQKAAAAQQPPPQQQQVQEQ